MDGLTVLCEAVSLVNEGCSFTGAGALNLTTARTIVLPQLNGHKLIK